MPASQRFKMLKCTLSTIQNTGIPMFKFDRWSFFQLPEITDINRNIPNINYEISGGGKEKVLVRFLLSRNNKTIEAAKYYFLMGNMDIETANILINYLINKLRVNYKFTQGFTVEEFAF